MFRGREGWLGKNPRSGNTRVAQEHVWKRQSPVVMQLPRVRD